MTDLQFYFILYTYKLMSHATYFDSFNYSPGPKVTNKILSVA